MSLYGLGLRVKAADTVAVRKPSRAKARYFTHTGGPLFGNTGPASRVQTCA